MIEPEYHLGKIVSEKEAEFLVRYNALLVAFAPSELRVAECVAQYKSFSELVNLKEQELLATVAANVKSGEMAKAQLQGYISKVEEFSSIKETMLEFINWFDEEAKKRGEEVENLRSEIMHERRAQRIKDRLEEDFWKSPEGRRTRAEIEIMRAKKDLEEEMALIRAAAERTAMENINRVREEEHRRQMQLVGSVGRMATNETA